MIELYLDYSPTFIFLKMKSVISLMTKNGFVVFDIIFFMLYVSCFIYFRLSLPNK